jgi:hypothetical protein
VWLQDESRLVQCSHILLLVNLVVSGAISLTGTIPTELGKLSNLRKFALFFSGPFYQFSHQLVGATAERIEFSGCAISGTVPSEILSMENLGKSASTNSCEPRHWIRWSSYQQWLTVFSIVSLNLRTNDLIGALQVNESSLIMLGKRFEYVR